MGSRGCTVAVVPAHAPSTVSAPLDTAVAPSGCHAPVVQSAGIAVPALLLRLIPRPLALIGLAIAIVGMLSTFTILTSAMDATLPIGRFGGLAWITAASITLPLTRHRDTTQPAQGVAA